MTTRYRVRTKQYLCLTPEEALGTGITAGEQIIEQLTLVPNPRFRQYEYAAVRTADEATLRKTPVLERGEKTFETKENAQVYIRTNGRDTYTLCGVLEAKPVNRSTIGNVETESIGDISEELRAFEKESSG